MTATVLTFRSLQYLLDEGESISDLAQRSIEDQGNIAVERLDEVTYVIHHQDSQNVRRLVLDVPGGDPVLPSSLIQQESPVLERLLAFHEMAESVSLRLPLNWGQYKHDDLLAFFVCSRDRLAHAPRWITQVTGPARDVCVWQLTSSVDQRVLQHFAPPSERYAAVVAGWNAAYAASRDKFSGVNIAIHHSAELDLTENRFDDVTQELSYSGWMDRVTPEQRAFVEHDTDHSIKLRGPAGSGKTLTLELKALREILRARDKGEFLRVLFVTHSWSLAGEVDANLDRLSEWGRLDELSVFPLLTVAQELLPTERWTEGLQLIGEDSLSDKNGQLEEIESILAEFLMGDWLTFRDQVSDGLRERLESPERGSRRAFAWDCLVEFGSVLGADGIFPGVNAERQYLRLPRAPWMMPLSGKPDLRLVLHLYHIYYKRMLDAGRLTSDQLVNDFLNFLETHTWNTRRGKLGYDLIFVDEFHLFSVQERQLLRYLSRSTDEYPKLFMALDPRQSPWEVYTGFADAQPETYSGRTEEDFGTVSSVDLPTVHRFSPEILEFVKHLNWDFPDLDLGSEWDVDFAHVSSTAESGHVPQLIEVGTQSAELIEIYNSLKEIRQETGRWHIALAVVDTDEFAKYKSLAGDLQRGLKAKVTIIESRNDVEVLQYRRRGIVIGPAEYLAGLQFDAVLIAGLPEFKSGLANLGYRRRRYLSLLYLAVTRASREVRIFANDEKGEIPEVLVRAAEQKLLRRVSGAQV
jgi:superfamily I DNA/RNA helicase